MHHFNTIITSSRKPLLPVTSLKERISTEIMYKVIYFSALSLLLSFQVSAQISDLLGKAKSVISGESSVEEETGLALKEALNLGVAEAVKQLSSENGYFDSPYKILIPDDAQKVIDKVKRIPGFENVERDLVQKMNEAAETAATKATPIFVDAIKSLTIKDATAILMGEKNAATTYLDRSTRSSLYEAFMPIIQQSLDEVNARSYWRSVVKAYNQIPFVSKMNPELDDHVNTKGLDGLFKLIEKKEAGIRENTDQRTTDLLRKVFSKQD